MIRRVKIIFSINTEMPDENVLTMKSSFDYKVSYSFRLILFIFRSVKNVQGLNFIEKKNRIYIFILFDILRMYPRHSGNMLSPRFIILNK